MIPRWCRREATALVNIHIEFRMLLSFFRIRELVRDLVHNLLGRSVLIRIVRHAGIDVTTKDVSDVQIIGQSLPYKGQSGLVISRNIQLPSIETSPASFTHEPTEVRVLILISAS